VIFDYNQVIEARLWVGTFIRPEDAKELGRMGITDVVSMQSDEDLEERRIPLGKLIKALADANIDLHRVPVRDFNSEDLALKLPRCVDEIEIALAPDRAKVYLHCTAGINRSPTAAAAYLMKSRGMSAQDAHDYLVSKRDCDPDLVLLERYACQLANDK
jgi:protein-tyrosine phosphatase